MQSSSTTLMIALLAAALFPVILLFYAWFGWRGLFEKQPEPVRPWPRPSPLDDRVVDLAGYRRRRGLAA